MAYFAEINSDNIVLRVIRVSDEDAPDPTPIPSEGTGQVFIRDTLKLEGEWRQTSYNTHGGVHYDPETGEPSADQSKAFRFNYATIGGIFDPDFGPDGAFIPPTPSEGEWTLDPDTALWVEVTT